MKLRNPFKKQESKDSEPKKLANVMVLDQIKGRSIEYIENPQGRQWRYNNHLLYCMKRLADGSVDVVTIPTALGILPEDLYDALHDNCTCDWMVAKSNF